MPSVPIAVDLTRLITRLRHASPTGIDRVDLAYARRYLPENAPRFGLVSTAFGPRILDRASALSIVESVASGWAEDASGGSDPILDAVVARFGGGRPHAASPRPGAGSLGRRFLQARTLRRVLAAPGPDALPRGTLYLHTSHLRLDKPERFDWLHTRRDIRPVFFVHDLIPISHPEYGRPGEAERHAVRMETIGRHATHVVVNSAEVGARFGEHLAARGLGRKPVTAAWLGVEPAFLDQDGPPLALEQPTFVVCGTLESRKNHLLLLNLWREFAGRLGERTPKLVLVGRRGWEAENVFDLLDRCPAIRAHVIEAAGLSTHALARLMRSATALLMPSFIEGYGLPIVEAGACGLPVVASDIPVHREIAGGFAHLLDPLDGKGWREAILSLAEPSSDVRASLAARTAGYAPPTWSAHFARVDAALAHASRVASAGADE